MPSIPYWVNGVQTQIFLEAGWESELTASQLRHPWQQVLIDDRVVPGVVTLQRVKRKVKYQKNKSSGNEGGSVTDRGSNLVTFTMDVEVYTASQLRDFLKFLQYIQINKKPDKRNEHLILHPLTYMCRVAAVVFEAYEIDAPVSGGPLKCKFDLIAVDLKKAGARQPASPATARYQVEVTPVQSAATSAPIVAVPSAGR